MRAKSILKVFQIPRLSVVCLKTIEKLQQAVKREQNILFLRTDENWISCVAFLCWLNTSVFFIFALTEIFNICFSGKRKRATRSFGSESAAYGPTNIFTWLENIFVPLSLQGRECRALFNVLNSRDT